MIVVDSIDDMTNNKFFMTLGELREIIKDLPDDTVFMVYDGGHVRDAWIDPEDDQLIVLCD